MVRLLYGAKLGVTNCQSPFPVKIPRFLERAKRRALFPAPYLWLKQPLFTTLSHNLFILDGFPL